MSTATASTVAPVTGSLSLSVAAHQTWALLQPVLNGTVAEPLFPAIKLRAVMESSSASFDEIKASKHVKQFEGLLSECKLDAQLGWNMSAGRIMFTVPIPSPELQVESTQQAVMLAMLGVLPCQDQLEHIFQHLQTAETTAVCADSGTASLAPSAAASAHHSRTASTVSADSGHGSGSGSESNSGSDNDDDLDTVDEGISHQQQETNTTTAATISASFAHLDLELQAAPKLLANACLELFMEQTGLAFSEKKTNFHQQRLTLTLDTVAKKIRHRTTGILYTDNKTLPFTYGPCYLQLSGLDPKTGLFSATTLANIQQQLEQRLVARFWQLMTANRYFASETMVELVSPRLAAYVRSAFVRGKNCVQEKSFAPRNESVMLYLHGTAGTGKSSFVKALRASLAQLVQEFFNVHKEVDVIKVPLNSMTPEQLRNELSVKGISDWSVERMLEQSLAGNRLAILHLEENPKDPQLQEQLFGLVQDMLQSLARRYPKRRSDLLFVFTSNYKPCASISAAKALPLAVFAPSQTDQQKLCALQLAAAVHANLSVASSSSAGRRVHIEMCGGPPATADMRPIEQWVASLGYLLACALRERDACACDDNIYLRLETTSTTAADNDRTIVVVWHRSGNSGLPWHMLAQLESADGYFFYPELSTPQRVATVLGMLKSKSLKPAVIVVRTAEQEEAVLAQLDQVVEHELQMRTTLQVRKDEDKVLVLGSPWDFPRGGLFKFIDNVNNPAGDFRRQHQMHFGIIVCHVNNTGQYILRELLENNRSQTHRQTVHKDGLLFLLRLDADATVSSTLKSRAHLILQQHD